MAPTTTKMQDEDTPLVADHRPENPDNEEENDNTAEAPTTHNDSSVEIILPQKQQQIDNTTTVPAQEEEEEADAGNAATLQGLVEEAVAASSPDVAAAAAALEQDNNHPHDDKDVVLKEVEASTTAAFEPPENQNETTGAEEGEQEQATVEMPQEHVLYPGGGNFNKLRKKQILLEQLLKDNVEGYIGSNSKREYVKEKILDQIPGGLKVFNKETGQVYQPDEHEAFDRVSQKIRDIKKYRLKAANNPVGARKVSQKRTTAPPVRRRRDPAEESVKEKLILEMRAEITRLRANVMTAHEKIRTLEQLHAHDERNMQLLLQELGVQQGPQAVKRFLTSSVAASVHALALTAVREEDDDAAEGREENPGVEEEEDLVAAADLADTDENKKQKLNDTSEAEPTAKKARKVVAGVGAVEV